MIETMRMIGEYAILKSRLLQVISSELPKDEKLKEIVEIENQISELNERANKRLSKK